METLAIFNPLARLTSLLEQLGTTLIDRYLQRQTVGAI